MKTKQTAELIKFAGEQLCQKRPINRNLDVIQSNKLQILLFISKTQSARVNACANALGSAQSLYKKIRVRKKSMRATHSIIQRQRGECNHPVTIASRVNKTE